jgi:type I restriction enzyme R subunit
MTDAAPDTRELAAAQLPALHLLINLGWTYRTPADCLALRGSERELLLKPRLIEYLQRWRFTYKGETYPLSPSAIDQILREVSALSLGEGLRSANEALYVKLTHGITVTEFMPDGRKHLPTVPLIDWADVDGNLWDVSEECVLLSSDGTHTRRTDMVAWVNGLPLVAVEAKRPVSARTAQDVLDEGISQHLRNQRHDQIPQLYAYAQLLLSISGDDARYGTTETAKAFWSRWREEEIDEPVITAIKNRQLQSDARETLLRDRAPALRAQCEALWAQPMLPTDQDRLLIGLLSRARLLEFLHAFVLFDRKVGKVVARYPQFFGIRTLLARIRQVRPDGAREGGVLWHTTGSGKSFTMVFLTRALLLDPTLAQCRVVVVTDRIDLEKQLARNFISGGAFGASASTAKEGERSKATGSRDLAKRIGRGSERIVFTLVQKFAQAAQLPEFRNPSADLIVLADEGHRSHNGETHERMRKALPNAAYIAFTGTPLLKNDKTANKFGPIVHAYSMQRAVDDGTVSPLLYEERVPELDVNEAAVSRWFDKITAGLSEAQSADLKKKFASKRAIYGAANRIELIAWDIASHFERNFKRMGLGLKGQVATDSKQDAVRYKRALDDTGLVSSAVIMSPPDTREGNAEIDEEKIPEVQAWWKRTIVDTRLDPQTYEKDTIDDFATDGDPDLLIVVDKLLTGFDEPRNTVLYIDKPLKDHTLIQAVARVNRLHDHKPHGLLVDYRGILKALDTAVRAYQDLETRTQGGFDLVDLEGLYRPISAEYKRLPGLHARLWSFFAEVRNRQDREQFRQLLTPRFVSDDEGGEYDARQKLRDDFSMALVEFTRCLETALSSRGFFDDPEFPESTILRYKADLQFFAELRTIARRDAMETVDYGAYEDQIRRLVDKQVIGERVREPEGVYVVHKLGQPEDPATWSEYKTRNETDLIRTRVRKTIEQRLADDPYAQKVFGELLKQAIAEAEAMFEHPLKQYALFQRFEAQVDARRTPGVPDRFGQNRQAQACYGLIGIALGDAAMAAMTPDLQETLVAQAFAIDRVVREAVAEYSLDTQGLESAIKQRLLLELYDAHGLEIARDVAARVVGIVRLERAGK